MIVWNYIVLYEARCRNKAHEHVGAQKVPCNCAGIAQPCIQTYHIVLDYCEKIQEREQKAHVPAWA